MSFFRASDSPSSDRISGASKDELFADVESFVASNGLANEQSLFLKAALVLQGEAAHESIPGITPAEIEALSRESERKWRQPWTLYFTIFVCSLGAIEQGWAQTSTNGATLFFPKYMGIDSTSTHDTLLVGLINAGIYISTGLFGSWISDPINNQFGRRGSIFLGSVFCLIFTIGSAVTTTWQQLLLCRLMLGIGLGVNASTIGPYIAETAPAAIRGGLAVSWQMLVAFGIFLGFVANAAMYNYGENAWRPQLAAAFLPTVPLLVLVYLAPESPGWYIRRFGRYDLAYRSLCRLRNTELQAAREVYYTFAQRSVEEESASSEKTFLRKVIDLFTVPRIRRATLASKHYSILFFNAHQIFTNAGFTTIAALVASCIFGFLNFLFAFPAVWTMDTLGRRTLLLITLPPMALTMLAASLVSPSTHAVNQPATTDRPSSLTHGTRPEPLQRGNIPLSHREVGMSFAVSTANVWASILSLTFPYLLAVLGGARGAFGLYAGLNVLAWGLVFCFVRETKRCTLEEVEGVFGKVGVAAFAGQRLGAAIAALRDLMGRGRDGARGSYTAIGASATEGDDGGGEQEGEMRQGVGDER
ncbi:hypothetical protein H2203_004292 [Taxawa tesnikishii (nom. ined.)]|nr:hypothetical protein H2203_004292 [Dothideales sp. JES 119]